jgi:internalin A
MRFHEDQSLAEVDKLMRVSPSELDSLLDQARAERWSQLTLVGLGSQLRDRTEDWPDSIMAADRVFQLSTYVEGLTASLKSLTGLTSLNLWGNNIGADGARDIAASLTSLTSLNLRGNNIGADGARDIAASLTSLTSLNLGDNNIGADGAIAIAASLTRLTSLYLASNNIGDDGASDIAASLTRLTSLNFGDSNIGADGARAIAASLTSLTSLNLESNNIGDNGARAIAASLTSLTSLNLGSNNIGRYGAGDIAASLTSLTSLNLWNNNIGNDGARDIAASLTSLTSLNLWNNNISADGAGDIAASLTRASLTRLTSLNLGSNNIGDDGARAIAASLAGLTSLNLWSNNIGDDGARDIAASLTGLTSLNLGNNNIGADGAIAIAASLTRLTSLYLASNNIGDDGASDIAASLTRLTSLNLGDNNIGADGARDIAASLTRLTWLDLGSNNIGNDGTRAIAASLTGLTSLNLWNNNIGDDGARAIAASLTGLALLDFGSNNIGNDGTRAIAASLTRLTSLNLESNNIGDNGARAIAASLTRLTWLNLGGNNIGANGARDIAASLTSLTSLDLGNNNIGADGAIAIVASLTRLTSLNLARNNIGDDGARAIAASLTSLTSLHLSNNNIGADGARDIAASLTSLTSLGLGDNNIGADGAIAIAASLTRLTSLDLDSNNIGAHGARAIAASLTRLNSLNLDSNNIGAGGARAIAASLTSLTSLNLGSNKIGNDGAGAIAASLTRLTSLRLDSNNIGVNGARAIAASLTSLTSLHLDSNNIGVNGARAIAASLTSLTSLHLASNRIGAAGARAILDVQSSRGGNLLRHLNLRNNGDLTGLLPKELLEAIDGQAILAAYRRFTAAQAAQTLRPLNELKLLVVGNEAVGKTSLLRYVIEGKPRNPSEAKTPGIVQHEKILVQEWSPSDCPAQLNVWDFGGQEMMRGTHRFFLTERSLYLLVLEDRRQDDRSIYEWMKTIRNRGGDSPVIVVINKSDGGKQDLRLDEGGLKETYHNIVAFLRTSCDPGEWAVESVRTLRRQIVSVIIGDQRLRHVLDGIPANWLQIKHRVSALASQRSVLTHADFVALCKYPGGGNEPIFDENEQRALLQLLHQLGTIVAHGLERGASAARREVSLLDPNWLTGAVYRILEKASAVEQEGEFLRHKLAEWLDPAPYPPERHEFILDMMQDPDIGLCFRVPTPQEERYLVPEALPASRPFLGKRPDDLLRFRYRYNYLPPSLIPRLIVESHRNVVPGRPRWRTGAVLFTRDCDVLVLADPDKRRIDLQADGPAALRRAALNVVLNDLEAVHALNPEAEPVALVPLPDRPDEQVRYDYLLELERRWGPSHAFLPEGAERMYEVEELLEGVRRDQNASLERPTVTDDRNRDIQPHTVILIHGIRTTALWQNSIRRTLEDQGFKVQPTNYGRFDLVRFLCPWQFFRRKVVEEITKQIRQTIRLAEGAKCSIIAHSFGTFIVASILQRHTDLQFRRIIFCGSVVRYKFRFEEFSSRFEQPLVNEVGTRDVWPVLAETVTSGYGSAGTFGFRRPSVRDRWHNGKTHSAFLKRDFCVRYWVPYLRDGRIVEDDEEAEHPPWWLRIVTTVQPRYLVAMIAVVLVGWFVVHLGPASWWLIHNTT